MRFRGLDRHALDGAAERNGLVADDGQRQCWATIRGGLGAGLQEPIARLRKASLGLPRALNNAATAALVAAASAGKALVDDECAKKAVAELSRD